MCLVKVCTINAMFCYALYFFKNYTIPMAYMIIMAFLEDIGGYFLN